MSVSDIAAAVFFGNVLTVAFVWGLREAAKHETLLTVSKWTYAALLLPLGFALLSFSKGHAPAWLDYALQ